MGVNLKVGLDRVIIYHSNRGVRIIYICNISSIAGPVDKMIAYIRLGKDQNHCIIVISVRSWLTWYCATP